MPMTKRLGAYIDVQAAFNTAITHNGGTLTFPTPGAARNWRQRAYYYRQLLGTSKPEYDKLQLHHEGSTVVISMVQLNAVFTAPTGEDVLVDVESDPPYDCDPDLADDPLLADAKALVQTIKS